MPAPEVLAAALTALDALGVALAQHGHVWTPAQRSAYERAVRLLEEACAHPEPG